MKRIVFLTLVLLSVAYGAMAQGQMTLTRFEGKTIRAIDASSAWQIEISQGSSTRAEINFPARLKNQIVFELDSNGELKLGLRGNVKQKKGEVLTAVVVCSSLEEVDLSGACSLKGNGKFSSKNDLEIDLSGAAKIELTGGILIARNLSIEQSGASKMNMAVSVPHVEIDLSGASYMALSGQAKLIDAEASGASKLILGDLAVSKAVVDISGASKAELNVSKLIAGEISGASKVTYKGDASTQVDVSGAASLRRN